MSKELIAENGVRHCFYEIENDVIVIRIIPNGGHQTAVQLKIVPMYEDMLVQEINKKEGTNFNKVGHLNKIGLENITAVSINCVNAQEGINALLYSAKNIQFKELILFTHEEISHPDIRVVKIDKLASVDQYNDFVLRLNDYYDILDSDYTLIVQDDGFVTSPELWRNDFLQYDYIGAPWPSERSWVEKQFNQQYMKPGFNQVGNGGFSLRSRKFLELSAHFISCEGAGEDTFLCHRHYGYMLQNGINFAPVEVAKQFSWENNIDDWQNPGVLDELKHFGFHGKNFSNSQEIIKLKDNI